MRAYLFFQYVQEVVSLTRIQCHRSHLHAAFWRVKVGTYGLTDSREEQYGR